MSSALLFLDRLGAHYVHDEACNEAAQIEAPIESIGEGSQVVLAVRAVLERVECACQRRIQIAQHSVDPLEPRQGAQLEVAPPPWAGGCNPHWPQHNAGNASRPATAPA